MVILYCRIGYIQRFNDNCPSKAAPHPAGMPDGLRRAFAEPFHIFQFPVGVRSAAFRVERRPAGVCGIETDAEGRTVPGRAAVRDGVALNSCRSPSHAVT